MLFTSLDFFKLLALTFTIYYLPFLRKYQVYVLIASSLYFYASHKPVLLLLLLTTILVNFIAAHNCAKSQDQSIRRLYTTGGVVINLLILFFFKYATLLGDLLAGIDEDLGLFLVSIPLPIGISFYTFQGISLMVDTYRGDTVQNPDQPMTKEFSHITLFISFFPQLVAGPIVKAKEFIPQIKPKGFKTIEWETAINTLILGYFLKSVIADNLKDHTFWIAYPYFINKSSIELLFMLFGYSMQIFADFAGYSLIAIGVGKLFGYTLPINFNFPYIARSFSEFWTRWHISLSSFLKQYLYIPMGGNRKGNLRTYFNLFITMTLGGFWHGAGWSYAIWGFTHGILLAIERALGQTIKVPNYRWLIPLKIVFVFIWVTWAWLLFKLPDFDHVIKFHESLMGNFHLNINTSAITYIIMYSAPVIGYHFHYVISDRLEFANKIYYYSRSLAYAIMLFLILTNSGTSTEFIYFQF